MDRETLKQQIVAAARRRDKVGIARSVLSPMLVEGHKEAAFELLALVLATPGGTIHRERIGFLEFLADLGGDSPAMVSDLTIKRAIKPFGRRPASYEDDDAEEN